MRVRIHPPDPCSLRPTYTSSWRDPTDIAEGIQMCTEHVIKLLFQLIVGKPTIVKRYPIHIIYGALSVDSIRLVSFILIVTSRRSLESRLYTIIIIVTNKLVDVGKHYLFGNQQIMPQFVPEHYAYRAHGLVLSKLYACSGSDNAF